MIPWQLLNTFAIPVAIYALPRALAFYRSLTSPTYKSTITPLPSRTLHLLILLSLSALLSLALLTPLFTPPNIFTAHPSNRPSTSTSTLLDRLSTQRTLTSTEDISLRAALASKSGRLLYYALGPDTLASCLFCSPAELDVPGATTVPLSYLLYQLPSQLAPHLLHLFLLGVVTASSLTNTNNANTSNGSSTSPARWRTPFLTLSLTLAALDIYLLSTYDVRSPNALIRPGAPLSSIDFFYWRLRTYRYVALASTDVLLAAVIYLSSTNRLFVRPRSPVEGMADKIANLGRVVEGSNSRVWAAGVVRNTASRSRELRGVEAGFWDEEGKVYEEREVVDAVRGVLGSGRIDLRGMEGKAREMAQVVGQLMIVPKQAQGGSGSAGG